MRFVKYDTATGAVLMNGVCSDEEFELQVAGPGQEILSCSAEVDPAAFYMPDGVITPLPASENPA